MQQPAPSNQADPRPRARLPAALRLAAIAATLACLLWFILPTFSGSFTEGFEASIGINAQRLLAGHLADADLLYPFNGRFFLLTRFGAALLLAALHAVDHLDTILNFRLLMLGSLALLLGSTMLILIRIYRVHPAWAALTCLLFPPIFVTTYFFNDNELSAGLSTLALLIFWRRRSLPATTLAAILLGLAVATRPDAAFLAPAFAALMWFELPDWPTRGRHALIAAPIVAAIPIALYAAFGLSYFDIFAVVGRALTFWRSDERLVIYAQHGLNGFALPALLALPLGLASFLLRRQWREVCLCIVTPVIFLLAYGRALHELRYLLPLSPFIAIAIAEGGRVVWRSRGALRAVLLAAFALAFLACFLPVRELPYWRLHAFRKDNDGPRPLIGQVWAPLVWLGWLDNLDDGAAAISRLVERAPPGLTVLVSDDWNSDRLLDLTILEHGFQPAQDRLPPACLGVAERFEQGPVTLLHIRTHIPFLYFGRPQLTWTEAGRACAQAVTGNRDVTVVGWRPENFDPPGLRPEDGVIPLFRPLPSAASAEFARLGRSAYDVWQAPLDRVAALLERPLSAADTDAAEATVAQRHELLPVTPPLHLVMPMAGHGSRFGRAGIAQPKPLIPLQGEPMFWWAIESIRRHFPLASLSAVILAEHEQAFGLGAAILARYPEAHIVALPRVTSGALETATHGVAHLPDDGWLVVNDCDHAFDAAALATALPAMPPATAGFLCHFRSNSPAYSYAEYDPAGDLVRTVEKQPITDLAIAGAYGFRNRATFLRHAEAYAADCPYPELFMSGVYNVMLAAGLPVRGVVLDRHISFGTPAELEAARPRMAELAAWRSQA